MDYLADIPGVKESCSILEQPTTKNGGTASCRSAVFFGLEEEGRGRERESGRRGEESEDVRGLGEGERGRRGWNRTERTLRWEENGTQRENENKDSEKEETRL